MGVVNRHQLKAGLEVWRRYSTDGISKARVGERLSTSNSTALPSPLETKLEMVVEQAGARSGVNDPPTHLLAQGVDSHLLGNQRVRRASPRGLVNSVDLVNSDWLGNQCDGWASLRTLG